MPTVGPGGPLTTIADTRGPFSGFSSTNTIISSGTVAFVASLRTGGQAIYTGSGGPLTLSAATSGTFSNLGGCAINDADMLAFMAVKQGAGGGGLFSAHRQGH
jgi:hypothetical protein